VAAWLGGELRTALSNLLFKAVSLSLEKVSRLVLVVVAARVLGQTIFGRFQFAATVTTLLALGTDLGLGIWTTRALARHRGPSAIVGTGLWVRTLTAAPYAVVTVAVALAVGPGDIRSAILLLGICALVDGFVDHFGAVIRGYERFADETRLNVTRALLVALFGLGALWLGRSLVWLAAGMTAASLASGGYGLWIIRRRYRLLTPFNGRTADRALARVALREALPIWLAGLLSFAYFKGDTVLLRLLVGDAELGAYSGAYKIFEGSMLLPNILLTAIFPLLARVHGDRERQRRWEVSIVAVLLGLGLLVGATCFLASAQIINVAFGAGFARAAPSLRLLSWGIPLLYLNFGLIYFLIARDLGRRNLVSAALMLVVNVSLNLFMIPRWGGRGAALTTVVTEALLSILCLTWLAAKRAQTLPAQAARDPGLR
jgi:O-antigen/teichoic acid export membrane protein